MKNLIETTCTDLNYNESIQINGGGPIKDAVKWYYMTVGSFYRGIYDGLMGNEPII